MILGNYKKSNLLQTCFSCNLTQGKKILTHGKKFFDPSLRRFDPWQNNRLGCIYKNPIVSVTEFTNDYIGPLLEKLSLEQKEIILIGDFNINILNCGSDKGTGTKNFRHALQIFSAKGGEGVQQDLPRNFFL